MKSSKHVVILVPGFASDEMDESNIPALQYFLKGYKIQFPDIRFSIIPFQFPFKKRTDGKIDRIPQTHQQIGTLPYLGHVVKPLHVGNQFHRKM